MVTESLTIPVDVSGDIDDAGLVESNQQGDCVLGVQGGEMYADCGFWCWICGGGMGFSSGGSKEGRGKVGLLPTIVGKGLEVEVTSLEMVGRIWVG